ncbi:hypothetical protein O181_028051 [Austropuccinia psidii MF-1]|uniref:Uncharacterized protein n=1 Tax=Austropuccinia psidii MF-1 TaxID=1389203 RepID=A0A9Q3H210_9BASI|nr:hypothetical protein [Austropuccinia psidii MF-1]
MKSETEPSYIWEINQYIEKVLNNTNILTPPTGYQGDDQSVEKERMSEAKGLLEDLAEDLFQRPMAEITSILQHFQDVFTGKVPFDQIPKSQEDDQYSEDPLEWKNIHGRTQAARIRIKIKIKKHHQYLKSLNVNPREEEDPH